MRLTIRHETAYTYQPAAPRAALRLKMYPAACGVQTPEDWMVSVNGEPIGPLFNDAWGDGEGLWFSKEPVGEVAVVAEGTIKTIGAAGVVGQLGRGRPAVFLRETPLTRPDDALGELAGAVEGETPLERLHALNRAAGSAVGYRPGATGPATSAAEALALGAGVCQDQSHVFIAAARLIGVPARYVVGYLHQEDEPLAETHAWAEAYLDGLGWVGFDPTHQVSPSERYVRLSVGLDAADAAPIRGAIQGAAVSESYRVEVAVGQAQQ